MSTRLPLPSARGERARLAARRRFYSEAPSRLRHRLFDARPYQLIGSLGIIVYVPASLVSANLANLKFPSFLRHHLSYDSITHPRVCPTAIRGSSHMPIWPTRDSSDLASTRWPFCSARNLRNGAPGAEAARRVVMAAAVNAFSFSSIWFFTFGFLFHYSHSFPSVFSHLV
jgi:hypothetical protein